MPNSEMKLANNASLVSITCTRPVLEKLLNLYGRCNDRNSSRSLHPKLHVEMYMIYRLNEEIIRRGLGIQVYLGRSTRLAWIVSAQEQTIIKLPAIPQSMCDLV